MNSVTTHLAEVVEAKIVEVADILAEGVSKLLVAPPIPPEGLWLAGPGVEGVLGQSGAEAEPQVAGSEGAWELQDPGLGPNWTWTSEGTKGALGA